MKSSVKEKSTENIIRQGWQALTEKLGHKKTSLTIFKRMYL